MGGILSCHWSPPLNITLMKNAALTVVLLTAMTRSLPAGVVLPADPAAPLLFARDEIVRAAKGESLPAITFQVRGSGTAQSYRIEKSRNGWRVTGADTIGAMYGGLDIAEAIRLKSLPSLKSGEHKPYIEERGIKFNIPLDLRTPSYSDNSDAAQANIPEVWSREFWREYFDEMARQRFNVLSLWSLNPFPSIVKVPEYPDVALNDVLRGRRELFDGTFSLNGQGMYKPEFLKGAEVVKRMTIDEKIAFWREVMQMARDRGIDVYWFTWNTFLFSEEGKDGLSRSKPDGNLVRYFRASVRETVLTYPLLAGIGITAGENMEGHLGNLAKEEWLWQTYGEGIRDALKNEPDRKFRMIHRFHMTDMDEVMKHWQDYPGQLDFDYKYAVAHMYGMTNPPFIKPLLPDLSPSRRVWLTLRNDDIYSFRWGNPRFARNFIRELPGPDKVAGFFMGPDGYCWGREAMDLDPESPRQLVMQKQWFSFMLWGRLSYDPALPDELFLRTLAARFPEVPADKLLAGWSAASQIFPEVTRFFWGNIDLRWLPEACLSHPAYKGFYTVRHFVEGEGMPESGNLNIREWRERLLAKQPMEGVTPLEVAANLQRDAATAKQVVAELRPKQAGDKELRQTLGDMEAFADLGLYYAAKIEGACEIALFDADSKPEHQALAIRHLEDALGYWRDYAAVYTKQYKQPLLYNRVGVVDIPKLAENVAADVELARTWKPGSVGNAPPRKSGGSKFGN